MTKLDRQIKKEFKSLKSLIEELNNKDEDDGSNCIDWMIEELSQLKRVF